MKINSNSENNYLKLLLLKEVLQATESRGALCFSQDCRKSSENFIFYDCMYQEPSIWTWWFKIKSKLWVASLKILSGHSFTWIDSLSSSLKPPPHHMCAFVLLITGSVPLQNPDGWDDSGVYREIPSSSHLLNVASLWPLCKYKHCNTKACEWENGSRSRILGASAGFSSLQTLLHLHLEDG